MRINYTVHMPNPATHVFKVEMAITEVAAEQLQIALPVWTPGSYLIREYAKNVNDLKVFSTNGHPLPTQKVNKNSWQILTNGADCVVRYEIYAFEESVRTCWLDDEHASIIPAAFFMWVDDYEGPVEIHMHAHTSFKEIACSLPTVNNNKWHLKATSKDELYDSPIEIGNHTTTHFIANNIPHSLAIVGDGNYDTNQIIGDLIKIIDTEVRIFGQHPCDNYLFILLNSNTLRGGLEHLFSTSLIFKRFGYQSRTSYLEFISLCAHEYFHLWNVKRLRPAALGPFNYNQENYTTGLWIAEGFTSYFDDLIVYRSGIYTREEYLAVVEKNINEAENAPGKNIHSVAEASFDAWIKYYRQNENSNNTQVNYYVRGGVLALMLDLIILRNSNGAYCIDNVMREAYETFYVQQQRGFTEEEFKAILEKYAGVSLTDFYSNHVFGTAPIDYNSYFAAVGYSIVNQNESATELDFGIHVNERNIITSVRKNSAGEKAGLNANDEILGINGFRYTNGLIPIITENKQVGETFQFVISRNGMLRQFEAQLQLTDKVDYKLTPISDSNATQQQLFSRWLQQS